MSDIYIHGFETDAKGRDLCVYSPLGGAQYTVIREYIKILSAVTPKEGSASINPAVGMANVRWDIIRPRYEAWKAGMSPDLQGTPLSAWNGVSTPIANVLRSHGVHTVEELAKLTDSHVNRFKVHGLRELITTAKRFEQASDSRNAMDAIRQRDEEIAGLKAQQQEMEAMLKELMEQKAPKRRGRPPKDEQVAA